MTFRIASCIHNLECMLTDTSITYASNDIEEIERCVNIDLDRIRVCYTKHE